MTDFLTHVDYQMLIPFRHKFLSATRTSSGDIAKRMDGWGFVKVADILTRAINFQF